MRQVQMFLTVIGRANLVEFYNQILSYATVHGAKVPSLDEVISVQSGEDPKGFDEKSDKFLEEQALKRLNERRAEYGR